MCARQAARIAGRRTASRDASMLVRCQPEDAASYPAEAR